MALRRLKPLLGAFEHIDAAIEVADAAGCRDEFRRARARIVEMVCKAADDDGGGEKAEALCALLDEAMAGSLATLQVVPAEIKLASGDLVSAISALRELASERVRGLARHVVRGWREGAKANFARATAEFARATAVMDVLDGLPTTPPPPLHGETAPAADSDTKAKKQVKISRSIPVQGRPPSSAAVVVSARQSPKVPCPRRGLRSSALTKPSANMGVPAQPKKTPTVVVSSVAEEERKMEATKRKLRERYQEAEDAKRRRTIQVIKPPRPPPGMTGQRQRNAHLAVRARGPARCAAERCFVKSSLTGMMV